MTSRNTLILGGAFSLAIAVAFYLVSERSDSDHVLVDPMDLDSRVAVTCSSCHLFPPPEILPRRMWRAQAERMKDIFDDLIPENQRSLIPFPVDAIAEWYEARAPEHLSIAKALTRNAPGPIRFRKRNIQLGPRGGPSIATVSRLEAGVLAGAKPSLVLPNMVNGSIHVLSVTDGPRYIGDAGHPARISAGDLDGDGRNDLVISDLGNTLPTDDLVGRVVVALSRADRSFEFQAIIDKIARVADARPVDLDGDGDLDIVVAAFGWRREGGVYVLRNDTPPGGPLEFHSEQIITRAGAVSVIPVEELTPGAGRGFVVAFAQQFEMVSVFHADGADYREQVLYRAPHPNWGTSNLEAVDLDGDSDIDFLLSHGDTLDDGLAFKPYHGVEWLENRGDGEFTAHRIGGLYGASAAQAADFDDDGDLDVVATGFLPQVVLPVPEAKMRVDSVIWFERTEDEWIPWLIEANHPRHTGAAVIDLNQDGRLDIVTAINRSWDVATAGSGPSMEVFFNEGPR